MVQADLAQPYAVQAMVAEAAVALGDIDVLVNNAAHSGAHPVVDVSYEDWQAARRQTLDVNLVGAANVIYWAVKHMKRGGRIVNLSSRGAFRGEPQQPAYGASKAGLNAMGQSLAVALVFGVRRLAPLAIGVPLLLLSGIKARRFTAAARATGAVLTLLVPTRRNLGPASMPSRYDTPGRMWRIDTVKYNQRVARGRDRLAR